MRLGVLVSGRGSNLEAVLEAVAGGRLTDVVPVLVISNRPDVRALEVAERYGVPSCVLRQSDFATVAERDRQIGERLTAAAVDVALLSGYDRVLAPSFFDAFRGRTINIHPALLPSHAGRGMIGLAVHASVLAAGDRETGVSIHEVTHELDAGPVIAQRRLPVHAGDTPESLAGRVLAEEHGFLVETLSLLARAGPRREG
ncbi:MAG: phosphoribosylglycinamide formyltransferase [Candidatus Limnocylindria bacterium]